MKEKNKLLNIGIKVFVIVLVGLFFLGGCGNKEVDNGKKSDEEYKKRNPIVVDNKESELKNAYTEYKNILLENESAINQYTWQQNKEKQIISKPIALYDINGDETPELFYVAYAGPGYANLHIITFTGGVCKELVFDNNPEHSYVISDSVAGMGTDFLIYSSKDNLSFYVCSESGDETTYSRIYKFSIEDNKPILVDFIENRFRPSNYYSTIDEYRKNGVLIGNYEGENEFGIAGDDFGQVIIYSNKANEFSAWNNFNSGDELAMSYIDMIAYIDSLGF